MNPHPQNGHVRLIPLTSPDKAHQLLTRASLAPRVLRGTAQLVDILLRHPALVAI